MKIGVIGVGSIGSTVVRKLSVAGHTVKVANSRGPESVWAFAESIGAAATDIYGAVNGVDVVFLSIPFPSVAALPKDLFASASPDVIVADTGNYYPDLRDAHIPEIDAGLTESVWVSHQLGRPVIKVFNNIMAYSLAHLGLPKGAPDRLAVAVAGDDRAAKDIIMRLVDETGFDPVDSGSLENSWRHQPCTPGYCCDYGVDQMLAGMAAAKKGDAPKMLAQLLADGAFEGRTHASLLLLNRSIGSVGIVSPTGVEEGKSGA